MSVLELKGRVCSYYYGKITPEDASKYFYDRKQFSSIKIDNDLCSFQNGSTLDIKRFNESGEIFALDFSDIEISLDGKEIIDNELEKHTFFLEEEYEAKMLGHLYLGVLKEYSYINLKLEVKDTVSLGDLCFDVYNDSFKDGLLLGISYNGENLFSLNKLGKDAFEQENAFLTMFYTDKMAYDSTHEIFCTAKKYYDHNFFIYFNKIFTTKGDLLFVVNFSPNHVCLMLNHVLEEDDILLLDNDRLNERLFKSCLAKLFSTTTINIILKNTNIDIITDVLLTIDDQCVSFADYIKDDSITLFQGDEVEGGIEFRFIFKTYNGCNLNYHDAREVTTLMSNLFGAATLFTYEEQTGEIYLLSANNYGFFCIPYNSLEEEIAPPISDEEKKRMISEIF